VSPNSETGEDDNVSDNLSNSFMIPSSLALTKVSGTSTHPPKRSCGTNIKGQGNQLETKDSLYKSITLQHSLASQFMPQA
jgi:hypothetical protein